MADWYDVGMSKLQKELMEEAGITERQAIDAYAFLSEVGLIDYDVEKEVISDRYEDDQ